MTINYKVSRDFVNYPDSDLDEFANEIITCMGGNPAFPTPPVSITPPVGGSGDDLTTLDTTFRNAIAGATGDPQYTAAKNKAREALLDGLRKDANYVQTIASHDLETLLSSGYNAASTNHVQTPLSQPVIVDIENLATTQLMLRLTPVVNAKSYQVQTNPNGNGAWQEAGIFTQGRRIVLGGLTPGTTYNVRARAVGGSTGYSEWSVPATLMAT
jgi:hypothetical protein